MAATMTKGGCLLALVILAGRSFGASERFFELRGRIEPAPARARVVIDGVTASFSASAGAGSGGRFRFRKLLAGAYVVTVFVPGQGSTRRSVDVTAGLADPDGRVTMTIPFTPSTVSGVRAPRTRGTVSVAELAIPDRARRDYAEALQRIRKQDLEGARTLLRQTVEQAPQFMMAWHELGSIAMRERNWAEAESCFRKALELRPGALMSTLSLAGVLVNLGRVREALPYSRFAVERSPGNAEANLRLGVILYMIGQDVEALKYLTIAKDLDPSHYSGPQLTLADLYLRRGDRVLAAAELEDFLARHPDAPNAQKVRDEIARLRR